MKQAALWLLLGMAAGLGIHVLLDGGDAGSRTPAASPGDAAALVERIAALETALADERHARRALDARVAALAAASNSAERAAGTGAAAAVEADVAPAGAESTAESAAALEDDRFGGDSARRRDVRSRLIEGGFTAERSTYIADRLEALSLEAMQARYDARRSGDPAGFRDLPAPEAMMRAELGDAEYVRYLEALGRPTDVHIATVIGNSPAAQAGFRPGDRIVGYAGARVFGMSDLQQLTFDGEPGETVTVDVLRDGQPIQLYLPRGPLGISGSGRRRGP